MLDTVKPSLGSGSSVVLALGIGALLVYQLWVRPDEGPRTIREKLANQ